MRRKIYGQSRSSVCPFCKQQATTANEQGIPVCIKHKKFIFPDLKCACGDYLDLKQGKFGSYFNCLSCGNLSWSKIMELYPNIDLTQKEEEKPKTKISSTQVKHKQTKARPRYNVIKQNRKEMTITSDELDFM